MANAKKAHLYLIDLVPADDGGYTVVVPALPGCISYGETAAEATRNVREAIGLHLENLAAHLSG
jgi:antitoxin HicB